MSQATLDDHGVVTGHREVRFARLLPGPIERVWTYITDPDLRGRWLASGPMELKVGGKVELTFRHGLISPDETPPDRYREMHENGFTQAGRVLACEPPRLLAITWGPRVEDPSEVTFELEPRGDEVMLTLTHRKLPNRGEMVNVAGGWHTHLAILEDRLRERPARPFWANWQGMEADYDARLPKDA